MKNVSQKVNEIAEYLSSYKQKVSLLNKLGLFDEAKHFELFALQIAELWFKEKFKNLTCAELRGKALGRCTDYVGLAASITGSMGIITER